MSITLAVLAAAPFADLSAIDRAVTDFAGGAAMPVDRRLRLDPCASPLALSWRTPPRDTVVVECPDTGGWRLFVPTIGGSEGANAPITVNRGDSLTIAASGPGFSVSQPGEALESGPVGGWIRVRSGGGQTMRAQVERPGMVSLPLP
jgi:flagellar basal body P-ring formation protein FlgA